MTKNFLIWSLIVVVLLSIFLSAYDTTKKQEVEAEPKLSILTKQVIESCYVETFQLENETTAFVGNVCDASILMIKEMCKTQDLSACRNPLLDKYLGAMGQ